MRGSVEDGLRRRRGLDGGGDVSNVVRVRKRNGAGRAALAPRRTSCRVGGAGEARLAREEA